MRFKYKQEDSTAGNFEHENPTNKLLSDLLKETKMLKNGITGDGEGCLLNQIKQMRTESSDHKKAFIEEFNNFAKHMTENNQKAVIEALSNIMKDFNNNLTEQFGENFKKLNSAVILLVEWQKQYKEELNSLKEYQKQSSKDMRIASDAFSSVVEDSKNFVTIADSLKHILEETNAQKDILNNQQKSLNELLSSMKDTIPEFSQNTKKMLDDIGSSFQSIQTEMSNHSKVISDNIKSFQTKTEEVLENHSTQLQSTNAEIKTVLIEATNKTQTQFNNGLNESLDKVNTGVMNLDKSLEKSLNDSLTSFGNQLTSLSNKFVQDYTPLTDELSKVVKLASRLSD